MVSGGKLQNLALLLLLYPVVAFAQEAPTQSTLGRYLAKVQPCYLWIAIIYGDASPPAVLCIFDGVRAEGTINEARGCMLGLYSVETATYGPLKVYQRAPVVAEGKRCSLRVALDLVETQPNSEVPDS